MCYGLTDSYHCFFFPFSLSCRSAKVQFSPIQKDPSLNCKPELSGGEELDNYESGLRESKNQVQQVQFIFETGSSL